MCSVWFCFGVIVVCGLFTVGSVVLFVLGGGLRFGV